MKDRKKKSTAVSASGEAGTYQADEELFESLSKTKKKKRKKRVRIIIIVILVIAAVIFAGMKILQRRVRNRFAMPTEEVQSAVAETGSLSTVVTGSGMIVNAYTETVSVPSGVEVTEILVKYGDTVEAGDMLAAIDMASVRSAMAALQEQIDGLDDEIADAKGDSVSRYVSAGVSGRVKIIYAAVGEAVEDIMVGNGSLAVISLDGYMAVDIPASCAEKGSTVTVTRADGSTVKGTVDGVIGGNAVVLVSDNGPADGEKVTVSTVDGTELATGTLYIHNPLAVTGYAGTVSRVNVSLNQAVSSSSTIVTLTDTGTTASYNALLRERSELEETLLELLKLQRDGSLVAPISGGIYSVANLDSDSGSEITDIVTISPDLQVQVTISVDETDILSLEIGQSAGVTVRSIGDTVLEGEVTEIDRTYANSKYTAVITLPKAEGMIPGMTANVEVRIEGVDNAVLIPAAALHQTANGYYVYTSYDEETGQFGSPVDVVPGLSNDDFVEIKSGLAVGDTVYYTETPSFADKFGMSFGGSGDFSGFTPGGDSGGFSGGEMPGGSSGGGGFPGGNSGGGGFPGGNSGGGGMPGGFGG